MKIRKYAKVLFIVFCVDLFLLIGFVYFVDPYGLFGVYSTSLTETKYKIGPYERIAKPAIVARLRPDAVILGSSRAEAGINPDDLAHLTGLSAYNFSIQNTLIDEIDAAFRHATQQGGARIVVVGLDYYAFTTENPDGTKKIGLINGGSVFDIFREYARMTISLKAVSDSIQNLVRNAYEQTADISPLGQLVVLPFGKPVADIQDKTPQPTDGAYKIFSDMLEFADKNDIDLYLYISPTFQSHLIQGPNYSRWADRVSSIVAKYDFPLQRADRNASFTSDPELYFDNSHFRPSVGRQILKGLFNNRSNSSLPRSSTSHQD